MMPSASILIQLPPSCGTDNWKLSEARRLMIPTKEFLQQVDKNESEGYRINISKVTAHFYIDESSVIARGRELGIFDIL